ncbi:YbaK/EbsC family protein [Chlorobium sp. N1]|uniref:aminoacyl-tRNA deacylase n=1 Tax=Chlorobium sp. N1 TaxID=2491138 RepID=UPI00103E8E71|nr:YbaK/EbsC family protein [Chlorobium sp. N1]TCD47878.1 YbaK/EbsC family protein [Chlorobium sp. N1]
MPYSTLTDFLDSHGVRYSTLIHSPAYTAQEVAASAHVPGRELAKAVVVKLDGRMAMAVLPASRRLDFELLGQASGAEHAELAGEEEFAGRFGSCEPGAMPPFGNLYGMAVYVDEVLEDDEDIAFNAGTHRELVRLAYRDFSRLVRPKAAPLSIPEA